MPGGGLYIRNIHDRFFEHFVRQSMQHGRGIFLKRFVRLSYGFRYLDGQSLGTVLKGGHLQLQYRANGWLPSSDILTNFKLLLAFRTKLKEERVCLRGYGHKAC